MSSGFCRDQFSVRKDVIIAALCCVVILILSTAAKAQEECVFDQQAQISKDYELARKFKNSRYLDNERIHVIERGAETISFSRGGCVHLGITIKFAAPAGKSNVSSGDVFRHVVSLVQEFGGGELATAEEVSQAIEKKKYWRQEGDNGIYYFLAVGRTVTFEFGYAITNGYLEIYISYYI